MAGWKIPTWGEGVGALVGAIPRIIKKIKDNKRAKEVNKINNAVDSNNDADINKRLQNIIEKDRKRRDANS